MRDRTINEKEYKMKLFCLGVCQTNWSMSLSSFITSITFSLWYHAQTDSIVPTGGHLTGHTHTGLAVSHSWLPVRSLPIRLEVAASEPGPETPVT